VPERAGVPRDRRAHLEDLHGVIGPEHVVQDDHPRAGQRGHPDRLLRFGGERVGPPQRAAAQLRAVEVGVAELEDAGAEAVLAGERVLGDEFMLHERAQQPVHRGLGEPDPRGDLGHAKARCARSEDAEDRGRPLYRLDHVVLSENSASQNRT
jgi:hypothetical protein